MFCQNTNAAWNDKLIGFLTSAYAENPHELIKSEQENEELKSVTFPNLLTLIALKILNSQFAIKKIQWKIAAEKGKLFINKQTGKNLKEINTWIDQVVLMIREE